MRHRPERHRLARNIRVSYKCKVTGNKLYNENANENAGHLEKLFEKHSQQVKKMLLLTRALCRCFGEMITEDVMNGCASTGHRLS